MCSRAQDRRLAAHVMAVHKDGRAPPQEGALEPLSADVLRAYIAHAKQHNPFFPEDLTGAPAVKRHPRECPPTSCQSWVGFKPYPCSPRPLHSPSR